MEIKPTAASADRIRRRNALGLRQVLRCAETWELTDAETAAILGIATADLREWRVAADREALEIDEAAVLRLSALLGIHVALGTLLPTPANRAQWWRAVSSEGPALGTTPLEFVIHDQGGDALLALRHDLDQWADG